MSLRKKVRCIFSLYVEIGERVSRNLLYENEKGLSLKKNFHCRGCTFVEACLHSVKALIVVLGTKPHDVVYSCPKAHVFVVVRVTVMYYCYFVIVILLM